MILIIKTIKSNFQIIKFKEINKTQMMLEIYYLLLRTNQKKLGLIIKATLIFFQVERKKKRISKKNKEN